MDKNHQFKAGMYLLETLTSGMYNNPLSVYREYIQNSVDSIDICKNKKNKFVRIDLNPIEKSITIFDNASGISSKEVGSVLNGIGSSKKTGQGLRGFRGIGRLGGIAFSEQVTFRTKSSGEYIETIQTWDCNKLNSMLANKTHGKMTIHELLAEVTKINKVKSTDANKSYFEVKLDGVSSFRNYIFDYKKVKEFISQVAPVDYNHHSFSFGETINKNLKSLVSNYCHYHILLNDKPIFKPYSDEVKVTKTGFDKIADIHFITFTIDREPAAYGWYGKRKEFIGSISKGDDSAGLRVRVGNILLGDEHLLDRCFREDRFNSYLIGEIHVIHPELIPNSRRDDFIDNNFKTKFYNTIEKEIGLPLSKEIRLRSRLKSNNISDKHILNESQIDNNINNYNKNNTKNKVSIHNDNYLKNISSKAILNEMSKYCNNCDSFKNIIKSLSKKKTK